MATRFYLPSSGSPSAGPASPTGWSDTGQLVSRPAPTTKSGTALTDRTATQNSGGSNLTTLSAVFVSEPFGAGTVSGTFSAVLKGMEDSAGNNAWLDIHLKVISGDGSTVRGTLYSGSTALNPSASSGDEAHEWGTSAATRIKNGIALSSGTAQAGDRIQIEIGHKSNTAGSGGIDTITFGDPAGSDYALTDGLTTSLAPWVELSATLPPAVQDNTQQVPSAAVAASGAPAAPSIAVPAATAFVGARSDMPATTGDVFLPVPSASLGVFSDPAAPGTAVPAATAFVGAMSDPGSLTASASPAVPSAFLPARSPAPSVTASSTQAVASALVGATAPAPEIFELYRMQVWTGSTWKKVTPLVWDGTDWVAIPVTVTPTVT